MFIMCETFTFHTDLLAVGEHCYVMIMPNAKLSTGVFWDRQFVYKGNCGSVFCLERCWNFYYYSAQDSASLSLPIGKLQ